MKNNAIFDCSIPDNIPRYHAEGTIFLELLTYSLLTNNEFAKRKVGEERYLSTLLIEHSYMCKWISANTEFTSLCDFYNDYTCETGEAFGLLLRFGALDKGALAFEYRHSLEVAFVFNDKAPAEAGNVLIKFLSGLLKEKEHGEASKYLESLLGL